MLTRESMKIFEFQDISICGRTSLCVIRITYELSWLTADPEASHVVNKKFDVFQLL